MTLTRRAVDNLLPLADMRPAFRDDALRMIGGLPGHPVTRAIRNGALRFDPPVWKDGHAALRFLASLLSDALTRVIADGKLPFEHLPSWDCTRPALDRVFGIDLHHHFLHAAPLEWLQEARLTEPQITRGFAHCLDVGGRATRTGRIQALLRALGSNPGDADSGLREARVRPEAPANRKRIDLLIEWTDTSRRKRGAVIEAKFGAHVTPGQLPAIAGVSNASRATTGARSQPTNRNVPCSSSCLRCVTPGSLVRSGGNGVRTGDGCHGVLCCSPTTEFSIRTTTTTRSAGSAGPSGIAPAERR